MPFKIVKTFENGQSKLTAVPNNWEANGILYWPRYNENKLKKIENSQPQQNWKQMNCKIKRSNLITWFKAEQEIEKMCKKSETETDNEDTYSKNVQTNQKEPTFHSIVQECITNDVPETGTIEETLEERSLVNAVVVIPESLHQDFIVNTDSTIEESITTEVQLDNSSLTLLLLAKMDSINDNLKALNESLIENTKTQTENIQTVMYGISNISVQVEHVIKQFSHPVETTQKTDIQLITSLEELKNFEKSLDDPGLEADLKRTFSVVCGKGKGRGINNAYSLVDAMFDRGFLHKCSWAGGSRSKEEKICFKSHTKIINFFFNMVRDSDNTFTLLDCNNFFKNILKNSRQRDASKKLRMSATKNRPKSVAKRGIVATNEQPVAGTSAQENCQQSSLSVVVETVQGDCQQRSLPVAQASVQDDRQQPYLPVAHASIQGDHQQPSLPVADASVLGDRQQPYETSV